MTKPFQDARQSWRTRRAMRRLSKINQLKNLTYLHQGWRSFV
ncbi:hypothetical protein QE361_001206 [Sphingomonas sp. SORGH_AS802]|nr:MULTISPECIES: hypothetical protein [unclassified Sphingomonas]MDR6125617.1 hypothetical protein [Sphingomonas sp. SORGH_AS_0438]MDR6134231.1 hypothetical protein [Sphingomonas sp. SORGH_AS_0802]